MTAAAVPQTSSTFVWQPADEVMRELEIDAHLVREADARGA
jgi:hypothetical protein